jgi:hypothetical protein
MLIMALRMAHLLGFHSQLLLSSELACVADLEKEERTLSS